MPCSPLKENGMDDSTSSATAIRWMTTRLAQGVDKTLQTETAFSAGFMLDPLDASGKKKRYHFRSDNFCVRPSRRRRKPGFC